MGKSLQYLQRRVHESLNYRLRTFAGGRLAHHCRPADALILLTENCNAKCVHCDIWKNTFREDNAMADHWKRTLTDLREWLGPIHVYFTGGEALMKPFAPEVVSHAVDLGLFVEFLTHGYWEDQTKIERLALTNPWRITISLDGIGDTHTNVRRRPKFWERSHRSFQTLLRMRKEHGLSYQIRLKTVIMSQNYQEVAEVARFASRYENVHSFYQAIEQNYNTPEDSRWFEHSDNWIRDTEGVVAVVQNLIKLKREGLAIDNTYDQLEAMIPYFRDPDASRIAIQTHTAHESRAVCNALASLQLQANGDVTVCTGQPPVGNITTSPIRAIWENRPHFWEKGCCLERRCSLVELQTKQLSPAEPVSAKQ